MTNILRMELVRIKFNLLIQHISATSHYYMTLTCKLKNGHTITQSQLCLSLLRRIKANRLIMCCSANLYFSFFFSVCLSLFFFQILYYPSLCVSFLLPLHRMSESDVGVLVKPHTRACWWRGCFGKPSVVSCASLRAMVWPSTTKSGEEGGGASSRGGGGSDGGMGVGLWGVGVVDVGRGGELGWRGSVAEHLSLFIAKCSRAVNLTYREAICRSLQTGTRSPQSPLSILPKSRLTCSPWLAWCAIGGGPQRGTRLALSGSALNFSLRCVSCSWRRRGVTCESDRADETLNYSDLRG